MLQRSLVLLIPLIPVLFYIFFSEKADQYYNKKAGYNLSSDCSSRILITGLFFCGLWAILGLLLLLFATIYWIITGN